MICVWIYSLLLYLCTALEIKSPWRNVNLDSLKDEYTITDAMSWRQAANLECDGFGGVLLPHSNISQTLRDKMKEGQEYWIGALEVYSPWKWTEDNSSLFELKGAMDAPENQLTGYQLEANEPYLCYVKCTNGFVGLQGKYCYCLKTVSLIEHVEDIRCPGSFGQFCGSQTTMSVYQLELPKQLLFSPRANSHAECGSITYNKHRGNNLALTLTASCEDFRYYACPDHTFWNEDDRVCSDVSERVCISKTLETWDTSRQNCSNLLIKLTNEIMQDLRMLYENNCNRAPYWIGLRRYTMLKLIDGSDFSQFLNDPNNETAAKCITISKNEDSIIKYERANCETYVLPAVCQVYKTTSARTTIQTTSKHSWSYRTGNTISTKSVHETTEPQRQIDPPNGSAGMIYGTVVGVIALLGLVGVVVLIWMKRNNRYCFQSTKMDSSIRSASRELATIPRTDDYELADTTSSNSVYYAKITKNPKMATATSSSKAADYKPHVAVEQNIGPRASADSFRSTGLHNDYEVADDVDRKDLTGITCPQNDYDLPDDIGPRTDVHDPKSLVNSSRLRNDYELAGSPGGVQYEYEQVRDNIVASDDYNTLHETRRDRNLDLNYSHLGAAELTGDLYDTTEPAPHGRTDNEMYSHIRGAQFEDDDMYNHTDEHPNVHIISDPEYSHTGIN